MPAEFAFRKSERLLKEEEYASILKRGEVFRRPPVQIFYLKKEKNPSRLGLWIGKKDFKRAVDRNRLKRRLREFFRKKKQCLLFPCDFIIQIGGRPVKGKKLGAVLKQAWIADSFLEKTMQEAGVFRK